jgi:DNA cross-link repair 1A protein
MMAERQQNQEHPFQLPIQTPTPPLQLPLSNGENTPVAGEPASASISACSASASNRRDAFGLLMTASKRQNQAKKDNAFGLLMTASKRQNQAKKKKSNKKRSSWRRRPAQRMDPNRVPSCKLIPTKPRPIVVDGFQFAAPALSGLYFLSHFHADHYIGLQKDFSCGLIFCSEKTRALALLRLRVHPDRIVALPLNKRVSLKQYDNALNLESVVLLDANHCPGACTFVFRLSTGKSFWHTGDFRFQRDMLDNPALREFVPGFAAGSRQLDQLYLDTTYCDPRYDFPPQQTAIDAVIRNMEPAWRRNDNTCFFFGTYTIGKEKVFLEAARHFRAKVCVLDAGKRKILNIALGDTDFENYVTSSTADTRSCRMFVVSMQSLSFERIGQILTSMHEDKVARDKRNKDARRQVDLLGNPVTPAYSKTVELGSFTKAVAFRPTGWAHGGGRRATSAKVSANQKNKKQQLVFGARGSLREAPCNSTALKLSVLKRVVGGREIQKISVPYSEHSSFSELRDCVTSLRPKRVIPTVGAYSKRAEMVAMLSR